MTKTPAAAKVEKPVPSQAKADDIREDVAGTVADPLPKAKAKPATSDAPYPTQADLDAIKEGRFNREVTAAESSSTYQTR